MRSPGAPNTSSAKENAPFWRLALPATLAAALSLSRTPETGVSLADSLPHRNSVASRVRSCVCGLTSSANAFVSYTACQQTFPFFQIEKYELTAVGVRV